MLIKADITRGNSVEGRHGNLACRWQTKDILHFQGCVASDVFLFLTDSHLLFCLLAFWQVICCFMSVILRPSFDRHMRRRVQNIFLSIPKLLSTSQGKRVMRIQPLLFNSEGSAWISWEGKTTDFSFHFTHSHTCTQTHTQKHIETRQICLQGSGWVEEQNVLMNILINLAKLI